MMMLEEYEMNLSGPLSMSPADLVSLVSDVVLPLTSILFHPPVWNADIVQFLLVNLECIIKTAKK